MNKILCVILSAMSMMTLTACGRRVPRAEFEVNAAPIGLQAVQIDPGEEKPTEPPREPLSMPKGYRLKKSCVIEGFETVLQRPELPTGCEITALAQTIRYYGFDADKVQLCDTFMAIDFDGYYTMDEVYLGDPHSEIGAGCNAPVIAAAANDYFEYIGSDWQAVDISGCSLDEVFYQIEVGRPVVVWSTIDQIESHEEFQFELGCGEDFYFNPNQHCLTVYGFDLDEDVVHVADPLVGNVKYDMKRFRRIYEIMKNQAIILVGNESTAGKEYTTKKEQEKWLEENRPYEDKRWRMNR